MPLGARAYPGVSELLAVGPPQLNRWAQRQHGNHHHVEVIHVFGRRLGRRHLFEHEGGNGGVANRVFDDPIDIFITAQDKRVGVGRQSLTRQAVHRRLAVQDRVGVVPMILRASGKEVHIPQVPWTLPTTGLCMSICRHRDLPPRSAKYHIIRAGLSVYRAITMCSCQLWRKTHTADCSNRQMRTSIEFGLGAVTRLSNGRKDGRDGRI